MRGAASDADVIVLLTDVYGEPLADEAILQKYAYYPHLSPKYLSHTQTLITNIHIPTHYTPTHYIHIYRLQSSLRPVIIVINKMDLLADDSTLYPTKFQFEGRNTTPLPSRRLSIKDRLIQKKQDKTTSKSPIGSTSTTTNSRSSSSIDSIDTSDVDENEFDEDGLAIIPTSTSTSLTNSSKSGGKESDKVTAASSSSSSSSSAIPMISKNRVQLSMTPRSFEELASLWSGLIPRAGMAVIYTYYCIF